MERATPEIWSKRVRGWRESGLSAARYASEIGVSAKALTWWKWQLRKRAASTPLRAQVQAGHGRRRRIKDAHEKRDETTVGPGALSFVELSAAGEALRTSSFEVVLLSGERVCVPPGFEAQALARVLDVLGRGR